MGFFLNIATLTAITLIAVEGVYLLTGMTGMFSFGQAGFAAVGAYSAQYLNGQWHLGLVPCLVGAMLSAMLVALVIGYPTTRLRSEQFALATLGFSLGLQSFLDLFASGGSTGVAGITPLASSWEIILIALLSIWVAVRIKNGRHGRALLAVRDDPIAAAALGISPHAARIQVFLIASALAGLSGALTAFYVGFISPDMFSVSQSLSYVIIVFFGGLGSITGSVAATIILAALPQLLQFAQGWQLVFYSAAVLVTILLRPVGILGGFELALPRFGKRGTAS